jgi:leader peptidase (prepilin peptidase)/N-methyltransferase
MTGWWFAAYILLGAGAGIGGAVLMRQQLHTDVPRWARSKVMISVITAALFGFLAAGLGAQWELVPYGVLAMVSVPLAVIDLVERRLPQVLVLALGAAMLASFCVLALTRSDGANFLRAVLAMAALFSFHLVLALLVGGLGAGDVKLSAVLGLATGWVSWQAVIAMLLLAYAVASIAVLLVRFRQPSTRPEANPLGPFLLSATFLAVVALSG